MLTLLEARQGPLKEVTGACTNSPQFRAQLNKATKRLMDRGDWVGTVVPIRVCVSAGCVVFPRYVGQIRQTNMCSIPTPINSMWYEFLPSCFNWESCYCTGRVGLTQWGRIPVFQDVLGGGDRLIRAYPRYPVDIGKTIRIFGTDDYGQALRTNNGDGTYSDGVVITLALPYGSTNTFVAHIDRVIKEVTQGPVDVYGYNSVTDKLEDIAHYDPGETLPSYARYKLAGCCETSSIVALVKLQFIAAEADTDLVLIDNSTALELLIQSAQFHQSGNRRQAVEYEADAVRELNRQLENEQPNSQIPVVMNSIEGSCFGEARVW